MKKREAWMYSWSFDGCTKSGLSVFALLVSVPHANGFDTFVAMMSSVKNGKAETIVDLVKDTATTLDEDANEKSGGWTSDGCPTNTGDHQGAVTQLRVWCSAKGPVIIIHCAVHQLHLITGETIDNLLFDSGEDLSLSDQVVVMRETTQAPSDLPPCPALSARW
eukprot:GHVU01025199.1.p2 GENE.GHVU01025199.1~~GHVU01025199.1.p2  ORF type:complete len:164 (-),score=22.63 GHVU01025199.1:1633-2124(-)